MGAISKFNDHEIFRVHISKDEWFDTSKTKVGRLPSVLSILVSFPDQRCG
jgi:hypothetical protein